MKNYLTIIIFALNVIHLTIVIISLLVDMEPKLLSLMYSSMLGVLFLIYWLFIPMTNKKKKKKKKTKNSCDCSDVNECEKWCIAKQNYTRLHSCSKTEPKKET